MSLLEGFTLLGVITLLAAYLALALRFAEGSHRDGRGGQGADTRGPR